MTDNAQLLKDIVQAARDGAEFYRSAARDVADAEMASVFSRLAECRNGLIAAIAGRLEMMGVEAPQTGTVRGALRKAYADVKAALTRHDARAYIAQLEATEDHLLAQVEQAIERTDVPEIRSQLQAHLPTVRACHDEMRRLKQRPAA